MIPRKTGFSRLTGTPNKYPTEKSEISRRGPQIKPHRNDCVLSAGDPDFISFSDKGVLNPLLPFGLSSPLS